MTNLRKSVLVLILFGQIAFWPRASISSEPNCAAPSLSQEIYECSKIIRKKKDGELNRSYRSLLMRVKAQYATDVRLGDELTKKIISTQRTWLRLRDADCDMEAFVMEIGSQAYETTVNDCIAEKSALRSKYLNQLF